MSVDNRVALKMRSHRRRSSMNQMQARAQRHDHRSHEAKSCTQLTKSPLDPRTEVCKLNQYVTNTRPNSKWLDTREIASDAVSRQTFDDEAQPKIPSCLNAAVWRKVQGQAEEGVEPSELDKPQRPAANMRHDAVV